MRLLYRCWVCNHGVALGDGLQLGQSYSKRKMTSVLAMYTGFMHLSLVNNHCSESFKNMLILHDSTLNMTIVL